MLEEVDSILHSEKQRRGSGDVGGNFSIRSWTEVRTTLTHNFVFTLEMEYSRL
jgi:hypothetical protein